MKCLLAPWVIDTMGLTLERLPSKSKPSRPFCPSYADYRRVIERLELDFGTTSELSTSGTGLEPSASGLGRGVRVDRREGPVGRSCPGHAKRVGEVSGTESQRGTAEESVREGFRSREAGRQIDEIRRAAQRDKAAGRTPATQRVRSARHPPCASGGRIRQLPASPVRYPACDWRSPTRCHTRPSP